MATRNFVRQLVRQANNTITGTNTFSGTNTFTGATTLSNASNVINGGTVTLSGQTRHKIVKITTTSVYTTTTLTAATHAGAMVIITTGTSLSILRHRVKLPNAATASTSGNVYTVVVGFKGTPTSNGVVVKPGTTTNLCVGTGTAGKGWKSSTRGLVGSTIALQSDSTSPGNFYIVGRSVGIAAASTSLIWRTTG